uniref:SnoaL-like domain-containing protein n=1 Tax=Corethron hystrix TaxID=216773 RepID=A0A7S1C0W1_9STRA|mmetsp:Transcript_9546/g.21185  ORF Transcript_9546/g.21185 Transcript_9546/m.21185 type:complete len:373 (+) Transcript_9546:64-1182(+)
MVHTLCPSVLALALSTVLDRRTAAFAPRSPPARPGAFPLSMTTPASSDNLFQKTFAGLLDLLPRPDGASSPLSARSLPARDLVSDLVINQSAYSSADGARAFAAACAPDVIYEDCYSSAAPVAGRSAVEALLLEKVAARRGKGSLRVDMLTDGARSCGFGWTFVDGDMEGLRGSTFVETDGNGAVAYVREIPEPLFKPGDLTVQLLEAVTKGAERRETPPYRTRTPTGASDIAQYLFREVQGSSVDESVRFFDEEILYRDFNFEEVLEGTAEVRQFIEDFNFPGITFVLQKIDDGTEATCFTWEVVIDGAESTVKGISIYEVDPKTRKVKYVRDVPESTVKPPPLGRLARALNPGLGVFGKGVPLGSRPGGR